MAVKFFISSFDVTEKIQTLTKIVERALKAGNKIILLPEYSGCVLNRSLKETSEYIWKEVAPELQALSRKHKAVIYAGTAPYASNGKFRNKSLLWANGKWIHYSKANLTPWEDQFRAGRAPKVFKWNGLRIAPAICFDIEFPEIAASLKKQKVDVLLCPSACGEALGSERVHRCASARAVELGAVVLVSPLLGTDKKNKLVDVNVGRLAAYYPSQNAFRKTPRNNSKLLQSGIKSLTGKLDVQALRRMKKKSNSKETRPFAL